MSAQTGVNTRVQGWVGSNLVTLYVLDCSDCGVVFGINLDYEERRRKDGRSFQCPNGHVQSWHETEADRLRKQAERTERILANVRDNERAARMALDDEKRRHAAAKGQLTKARNRAAKGVCPHPSCHRSFVNVARHVATQHPELVS